jgi:hypothetical protein
MQPAMSQRERKRDIPAEKVSVLVGRNGRVIY